MTSSRALVAVLVVALAAFVAHGVDETLEHDEGVSVVTARAVADGALPYVEAFDNVGPIGPWYGGAAVALGRLVGGGDVTSSRVAYLPIALLAVALVFALVRSARGGVAAAVLASLALVALPAFSREALSGPRPKLLVVALELAALLAAGRHRWTLAGIAAGLATLVWQVAALVVVAVAIVAVLERPRVVRRAFEVLAGAFAPIVVVVSVFALTGRAFELWEGFVTWNLRYTASSRPERALVARFVDPVRDLIATDVLSWPLAAIGLAALGIAVRARRTASPPVVAAGATLAALWIAWTVIDEQSVVDLLPLLPLAAFGFGLGVDRVVRRGGATVVVAVAVLLAVIGVETLRTRDTALVGQRVAVERVVGDGALASYDDPVALALAGTSNPSRYFFRVPGLDEALRDRGELEEYVDAITHPSNDVVAARIFLDERDPLERALRDVLAATRRPVRSGAFSFWVGDAGA